MLWPPGVVPPYGSLECEFVCQPTFTSAGTAQFMLGIEEGQEEVEEVEEVEEEGGRKHQASNMLSLVAQVVIHNMHSYSYSSVLKKYTFQLAYLL